MELSDVTFNVRCRISDSIRSVYVCTALHKTILAARSPVFAVMFKHPSKEKLAGIVNVPDIEPDVFKVLLRYIYIGQVPLQRMDKLAIGLLAAADKYLLEKLKKACRDHLVNPSDSKGLPLSPTTALSTQSLRCNCKWNLQQ